MARQSSTSRVPASLEASLDEENREVLAALDAKRSPSPALRGVRTATPPPPIRSMLDVPQSPTPRHGSIAGIGVGITSPRQDRSKSKLDPTDPSTWMSPPSSKPNSPTLTRAEPRTRHGSEPEVSQGYVGLPRVGAGSDRGFEDNYKFDISSIPSSGKASKSSTASSRPRHGSGAMAAALSGDFSNLYVGMPAEASGRGTSGTKQSHSRSPSGGYKSPIVQTPDHLSPTSPTLTTAQGTIVDDNAHRRLSNKSSSFSNTDEEEGSGRVPKDQSTEEAVQESSDEDQRSDDSDGEERGRERKRGSHDSHPDAASPDLSSPEDNRSPASDTDSSRKAQTIQSMLEPSIAVTTPSGEKKVESSPGHTGSGIDLRRLSVSAASADGDNEEDAIAKAKSLALNISPLDTQVQDRHVRMIIRGDWFSFNDQSKTGSRATKTYLCCSDLSQEANHALEWTIGTILRDGDTLLAMYAIEDETAESRTRDDRVSEAERSRLQQEGAKAAKDASSAMEELTRQTTQQETTTTAAMNFTPATELQNLAGSVDARSVGRKEMERLKAIDAITQTFLKFVRKTTLQVRCMIEVIHCKSPKHLILGAIDELEPTLCIVGTRGRSSLKGVLLGSFSNYLVTKSSSPVMVARNKLKKPKSSAKITSNRIRLSNNLTAGGIPGKRRSLTQARID